MDEWTNKRTKEQMNQKRKKEKEKENKRRKKKSKNMCNKKHEIYEWKNLTRYEISRHI